MTVNGNERPIGAALLALAVAAAMVVVGSRSDAADIILKLRATGAGSGAPAAPLSIEVFRWSTDAERAPLVEALTAPPPPPERPSPPPPPPAADAGGRGGGRGGRGGRAGGPPPPPPTPIERLGAAIKAAPTVGFIWNDGPVGYSIKYASKVAMPGGAERIVLVADRRIGAEAVPVGPASTAKPDVDFTVIDMRLDARGNGEGRMSITGQVVADAATKMLALDGAAAAPAILKVTR